jgi:GTPase SAR1 family protein
LSSPTQTNGFDPYYKIVFLGKQGVGKTSIIRRLVASNVETEYVPTLGIYYYNLELEYQKYNYYLQFWDVSNSLEYQIKDFLHNTAVTVLVFDYKDKESHTYVNQVFSTIRESNPSLRVLLVGNRSKGEKEKPPKYLNNLVVENNLIIYTISPQNNSGMSLLLQAIVQDLPRPTEKE